MGVLDGCATLLVGVLTRGLAALSVLFIVFGGTWPGVHSLAAFTLFARPFIGCVAFLHCPLRFGVVACLKWDRHR